MDLTEIQRRYVPAEQGAELRAEGEGAGLMIRGLAVPWDSLSVEIWRDWQTGKPVYEKFSRGAFTAVLAKNPDVTVLRDHDRSKLLARTSSGTAKVFETERGLEYEFLPPNTEDGRTVVELVRRRDLVGSSFAFLDKKVSWDEEAKRIVRTVEEVSLLDDVSPVTRPAYPRSSVAERSASEIQRQLDAWRGVARSDDDYQAEMARLLEAGL